MNSFYYDIIKQIELQILNMNNQTKANMKNDPVAIFQKLA